MRVGSTLGVGKFLTRLSKMFTAHIMAGIKEKWRLSLPSDAIRVFIDRQFIGIEKSCEQSYEQIIANISECVTVSSEEKTSYTINTLSDMLYEGDLWARGVMFGVLLPCQGVCHRNVISFKETIRRNLISVLFNQGTNPQQQARALWSLNKITDCLSAFSLSLCTHFMETLWTEADAIESGVINVQHYTRRAARWRDLYPCQSAFFLQFCRVETASGEMFASLMTLACGKVISNKGQERFVTGFTGRMILTVNQNQQLCATSLVSQKYGNIPTPNTVLLPYVSRENTGLNFKECPLAYSDVLVRLSSFKENKKKKRRAVDVVDDALSSWAKQDVRSCRHLHADVAHSGEDSATADVIFYTAGLAFMNAILPDFYPSLFVLEGGTHRFYDFRTDCVFSETGMDKSPDKAFSDDIAMLPALCQGRISIFAVGQRSQDDKDAYLKNFENVPALFGGTLTLQPAATPLEILKHVLAGHHALIVTLFPKGKGKDEGEDEGEVKGEGKGEGEGHTSCIRLNDTFHRKTRKAVSADKSAPSVARLCSAVLSFFHDRTQAHESALSAVLTDICFDCVDWNDMGQTKVDFYTILHLFRDGLTDLAVAGQGHVAEQARAVLLAMGQTKGRIASDTFFKSLGDDGGNSGNTGSERIKKDARKKEDMACAQSLKSLVLKIAPLPVRVPRTLSQSVSSGVIEIAVTKTSRYIALKNQNNEGREKTAYDPRFTCTRTLSFREKFNRASAHNDLVLFDLSERVPAAFDADGSLFPKIPSYNAHLNKTLVTVTHNKDTGEQVVYHAFYEEKGRLQSDRAISVASLSDGRDAALSMFVKSLKDETFSLSLFMFMKACYAHFCRKDVVTKQKSLDLFGSFTSFIALAQEVCRLSQAELSGARLSGFSPEVCRFLREHVTVVEQPVADAEGFASLLIDGFLLVSGITSRERTNKGDVAITIECTAISEHNNVFLPSFAVTSGFIVGDGGELQRDPKNGTMVKRSKVDKRDKGHTTRFRCPDKLFEQKRNEVAFDLTAFLRSARGQGMQFYPLPYKLNSGINAIISESQAGILLARPVVSREKDSGTLMPYDVLRQDVFVSVKGDETTHLGIAQRSLMETIVVCKQGALSGLSDDDKEMMRSISHLMLNLHSGITTIAKGTKHTTIFSYT